MTSMPPLCAGEERQADESEQDVQQTDAAPRRKPSAPPATRTPNVWPVSGTGGVAMYDLRREPDEQGARGDEDDVPHAGVHPLGQIDRNEEIGEGDAPIRGSAAVDPRDNDRHRRESSIRVHPRTGQHRRHSYWTARMIEMRLAMRAG